MHMGVGGEENEPLFDPGIAAPSMGGGSYWGVGGKRGGAHRQTDTHSERQRKKETSPSPHLSKTMRIMKMQKAKGKAR